MNRIFEVQDKTGRKIHLSKERWSHIQRHPEMSNQIDQIIETLKSPQTIRTFEYDSNVNFIIGITKTRDNIYLSQ